MTYAIPEESTTTKTRHLLLLSLMSIPLVGAPTYTPFEGGGIDTRCNISHDATVPSRETYPRMIAGIWNPTGSDGASTPCTVPLMEGKRMEWSVRELCRGCGDGG
jgi:hypothetical protein